MQNSSDTTMVQSVVSDLQGIRLQKDVGHTFKDISKLLLQKPAGSDVNLKNLNSQADLKKLGLDNGFQIVGFDSKYHHGTGGLIVSDKDKVKHFIDAEGNEFSVNGNNKPVKLERSTHLPKGAKERDPKSIQLEFGERGRQMDLSLDGKTARYELKNRDSLWQLSADLLGKNSQHLTQKDIKDINDEIRTLVQSNHIKDPDKIYDGKSINIPIPSEWQEKAKEAIDANAKEEAKKQNPEKGKAPIDTNGKDEEKKKNESAQQIADQEKQKQQDAKLAASAFHPDADNPSLKPQNGIYSPLLPKGLAEGTPTKDISTTIDNIRSRTVTGTTDPDGTSTRTYNVELADGIFWDSKFTAHETLDPNGGLVKRDLTYSEGYGDMKFRDENGNEFRVKKVKSIVTDRQTDGAYVSTITDTNGATHKLVTDLTLPQGPVK